MRINQNNPNIQLQNMLGMEQAARKEAQDKTAESAKAHEAEEALRLKEMSDAMKEIQGKRDQDGSPKKGYRNASYNPDGTVKPEGPDLPPDTPNPPPRGGIDFRA